MYTNNLEGVWHYACSVRKSICTCTHLRWHHYCVVAKEWRKISLLCCQKAEVAPVLLLLITKLRQKWLSGTNNVEYHHYDADM